MPRAIQPRSPPLSFVAASSEYCLATSPKSVPLCSAVAMSFTFLSWALNAWKSPPTGFGAATWIIATCTCAVGELTAASWRLVVNSSRSTS